MQQLSQVCRASQASEESEVSLPYSNRKAAFGGCRGVYIQSLCSVAARRGSQGLPCSKTMGVMPHLECCWGAELEKGTDQHCHSSPLKSVPLLAPRWLLPSWLRSLPSSSSPKTGNPGVTGIGGASDPLLCNGAATTFWIVRAGRASTNEDNSLRTPQ